MRSLPVTGSLSRHPAPMTNATPFAKTLTDYGYARLSACGIETLQINVGKLCNQTCHHCHVDAGPQRTEVMSRATMDAILSALRHSPAIQTVDLTGGAPEMNPDFDYLVTQCRTLGRHVIDRCNLTVFFVRGKDYLPQFLADHQVEIIASLPCYVEDNVDEQRGKGVFDRSIAALRLLNQLGYGVEGSGLVLNLAYNPLGPKLPPAQADLEADYKQELAKQFGLSFNHLYTITNMPISRFLDSLQEAHQYEQYMELLINSFNPAAIDWLMCRKLLSVAWDGRLYDCDFNQMLDLPLKSHLPQTITNFDLTALAHRPIATAEHCYGCTAGAGSSCGGVLTE